MALLGIFVVLMAVIFVLFPVVAMGLITLAAAFDLTEPRVTGGEAH